MYLHTASNELVSKFWTRANLVLWKVSHDPETIPPSSVGTPDEPPWRQRPRPPVGFADLVCGNGLLTHILTSEGYAGYRIDLRAPTSWAHYPQHNRASSCAC
jgi:tRNASer (uridine44-2'-O)-methyltransferase